MSNFFVFLLLFTEIILWGIAWILFEGEFISPSVVTLSLFILSAAGFVYRSDDWNVIFTFKAYMLFILNFILMMVTEKWISKHHLIFGNYLNHTSLSVEKICEKKTILYSRTG